MISTAVQYLVLTGFDDPAISPEKWNDLLAKGTTNEIFLTWQWQKVWWDTFGHGKLLLVAAMEDRELKAIAPLFADSGMIYFIGSGGSDYLDFIGDISEAEILEELLRAAVVQVPDFLGFLFYHLQDRSLTSLHLSKVAERCGWSCIEEGEGVAPRMELKMFPGYSMEATRKKSLLRHEAWFSKNGGIEVKHAHNYHEVLPHLEHFFQQHIDKWKTTSFPSLFLNPEQCLFYQKLAEELSKKDWFRFTKVIWQNKVIAYHFGFNYKGSFFWYKPTFDISFSKHSPGEVLLRQLILLAIEEDAHVFDFGLGDEAFKKRFETNRIMVRNWGLYP
jgi:CelD/BcsL family acetyltransferase involved in cellulose biosynthesis